jgi:hypothetical protein
MCLNVLHSNLNLFDSLNLTSHGDSERMLKNHEHIIGLSVDCGFYSIAYMDAWDGLHMKDFDQKTVIEYKKIVAYKIYHSKLNRICRDNDTVRVSPKRQKKN